MRIEELTLHKFKSFRHARMRFPPLTLILGSNASGKSNIRDALRLLHGISREYSLSEILGGAFKEGVQVWSGVRGAAKELCTWGEDRCTVTCCVAGHVYSITIEVLERDLTPRVVNESLYWHRMMLFDSRVRATVDDIDARDHLQIRLRRGENQKRARSVLFASSHAVLPRVAERLKGSGRDDPGAQKIHNGVASVLEAFRGLRFLDLSPEAMRIPSIPGNVNLGDNGENLSSVIQAICANERSEAVLASWLAELTPMDIVGIDFAYDLSGKILLQLREGDGSKISAHSASDGTLRFLGMLAALLSEGSGSCFFLEEIDNGIHPARLDLLMKLLRDPPAQTRRPAVISTTHSPSLLRLLGPEGLDSAILTYRPEGRQETRAVCLQDVKGIGEALQAGDLASLHESSWFEDVLAFTEDDEENAG